MIYFKKIRYKNILSTGNQFTEINLCKHNSTLIIGENGAGKSTILDALCFSLYGKPFRKINKPQLLNSINQKNLVVEIEFSIGKKEYKVCRGIKPNLFEIYQNGELLNQNAEAKDYQAYLESNILKLNFKSFSQIVILGSASFVPFMQLQASHRREIIEDLLDIEIFSIMNNLLKDKVFINKASLTDCDHRIDMAEQKIEMFQKHVKSLVSNNKDLIKIKQKKIKEINEHVKGLKDQITVTTEKVDKLFKQVEDDDKVQKKINTLHMMDIQLTQKQQKFEQEIKFFKDHDNCPTCKQSIEDGHKHKLVNNIETKQQEIVEALEKLVDQQEKTSARLRAIQDVQLLIGAEQKRLNELNTEMQANHTFIKGIEDEIESIEKNTKQIDVNNKEIDQAKAELQAEKTNKENLILDKQVMEVAALLLKDTGIKTKIIKQYVPIMNKLINKYLAAMDFFVNFELNENFEEKIKSRFRDEFSYESFSEGEKLRIDLALLFTWRAIAKLRNSASTNLLIMDEVFDSSLDGAGTEEFLKILNGLTSDTNVFIISHKGDQLFEKFEQVLKFVKHKNFSKIS